MTKLDEQEQAADDGQLRTKWREKSANGIPMPITSIERTCHKCGASHGGLAWGKTGEIGPWDDWRWYCSLECAPERVRARIAEAESGSAL